MPNDIALFIAAFCQRYKDHRKAKYFVRRPKDLALAKTLLETFEADELLAMVDDLLTTDDEWIAATDRGIGILTVKASWLANRLAQRQAPAKEFWGDECQREHGGTCPKQWTHAMRMRESA